MSSIKRFKVAKDIDDEELLAALNYKSTRKSKLEGITFGMITVVKLYRITVKGEGHARLLLKCDCGAYCKSTPTTRFESCSCKNSIQDTSIVSNFHTKHKKSEEYDKYCSYCESYRSAGDFVAGNNGYCDICRYVIRYKLKVGSSFDEIIGSWDSTTHKADIKKLPYLKGNSMKGYKVGGFTYVDSNRYNELIKIMWVKTGGYVKTNYSKDNLIRLGRGSEFIPKNNRHKGFIITTPLHDKCILSKLLKGEVVDHINGYTLDNRSCNLRVAGAALNSRNSKKHSKKKTSSKFKGLTWRKQIGKYLVRLHTNKECHILGYFSDEEEAAKAYDTNLRSLNLEGSLFNFPEEGEASVFR